MLTKDTGICIRAVDYSETSQVVTFFTGDHGKTAMMAKGSKRPKSSTGGPIELLSYGTLVFSESHTDALATLTEFDVDLARTNPTRLSSDLYALHCCMLAVELLDKFTNDGDPHQELFDNFVDFAANMGQVPGSDEAGKSALTLLIVFELALLKEVGLRPVLERCANCKCGYHPARPGYYFSSSANGLICRDCEPSFPDKVAISTKAVDCLARLAHLAKASEATLKEIERVLVGHFTEQLNRPPKMAKHVLG